MAGKRDDQLFFVQNEAPAATEELKKTPKSVKRKRPLRSLSHLYRDPVISGVDGTTQQKTAERAELGTEKAKKLSSLLNGGVFDSSEEEEDYDVSSRFTLKRKREKLELARATRRRLKKSALKPVAQDIWADDAVNGISVYTSVDCITVLFFFILF